MKLVALLFSLLVVSVSGETISEKFARLNIDHPVQTKPTCIAHSFAQLLSYTQEENIPVTPWEETYLTFSGQTKVLGSSGAYIEGFLPTLWQKYPSIVIDYPPDVLPLWGRSYKNYLQNLILILRCKHALTNGNLAWARLRVQDGYPVSMGWWKPDWSTSEGHSLLLVGYNPETETYTFRNWWEDSLTFTLPKEQVEGYMVAMYSMHKGSQNTETLQNIYASAHSRMVLFVLSE
jgi:hypothetical protein